MGEHANESRSSIEGDIEPSVPGSKFEDLSLALTNSTQKGFWYPFHP